MTHLEVHSNYSLLEGTAEIRQLVARAVEYGMKNLALTDTGGLYGALPFYQAARQAGINPILGAKIGPCVLLARDREGYAHLCEVVSACQLKKTTPDQLEKWPFTFGLDHLFLLSSHLPLLRALHRRGLKPMAALTHYGDGASRQKAEALHAQAIKMELSTVAVSPVYFLEPNHFRYHRVLAAVRHNSTVAQLRAEELAPPEAWFHSPRELERLYAAWPEALDNTAWVAEECRLELPLGTPLFPSIPLA